MCVLLFTWYMVVYMAVAAPCAHSLGLGRLPTLPPLRQPCPPLLSMPLTRPCTALRQRRPKTSPTSSPPVPPYPPPTPPLPTPPFACRRSARFYVRALELNPSAPHVWSYLRTSLSCAGALEHMPLVEARDLDGLRGALPLA